MLITITNSGKPNGRPTSIGANTIGNIEHAGIHVFTLANFTTETSPQYSDPEDDPLKYIKITSILSGSGMLKLNGVSVVLGQIIQSGDISSGNLKYESDPVVRTNYSANFEFDIADSGSSSLSGLSTGIMTMGVIEKANLPPTTVGNGTVDTLHAVSYVFDRADFTTNTIPVYLDPENDPAGQLKILSLPVSGTLSHNGTNVIINHVIPFTEIDAGYFMYIPDPTIESLHTVNFDFSIADTGSGIFVE